MWLALVTLFNIPGLLNLTFLVFNILDQENVFFTTVVFFAY